MKKLLKRITTSKPIMITLASLAMIVLLTGFFFLGVKHGVETMTIKNVAPDELANAMQEDHFYSSYRENTLLVKGRVASISPSNNDLVVEFMSSASFKASCDFGNSNSKIHEGDNITILTEAASAQRQPNGVLLTNCVPL